MSSRAEEIHALLTGDDEGRVCRDIPDSACKEQPRPGVVLGIFALICLAVPGWPLD